MTVFLSEESISIHKEYTNKLKLQYSIIEKSIEGLKGKSIDEILRMRLKGSELSDILSLLPNIKLHDIYFDSFSDTMYAELSEAVADYKSVYELLNEVYRSAMNTELGFVVVSFEKGRLSVNVRANPILHLTHGIPLLAIDVSEHAYFLDYGFDKERYLLSCLPYLNISKINNFYKTGCK